MTSPYPGASALVIDASVLRGAGATANNHSRMCSAFLEKMLASKLSIVDSPDLAEERRRHASRFASRWFSTMVAKKRILRLRDPTDPVLRAHLEDCAQQRAQCPDQEASLVAALTKDACLVEASNACDKAPISSLDNRMRVHLQACAKWVPEIQGIVWVNAANADETPLEWLDGGAAKEPVRMLATGSPSH